MIGVTCQVQYYMDRDPGPEARDFRGGANTIPEFESLSIRLADLAAEKAGVEVLAAAPGTVVRLRDGISDVPTKKVNMWIKGIECGNGVAIDHGGGWETQYCHFKKKSLRVSIGQKVHAGDVLGQVGLSGYTEYPHLDFIVRNNNRVIDPFDFEDQLLDIGHGKSIWSPAASEHLEYSEGAVLNSGFTVGSLRMADVERGNLPIPAQHSKSLVAYVRAIDLKKGDVQILSVVAPDGSDAGRNQAAPLDSNKGQYMIFVGKPRAGAAWATGTYRADYQVQREGKVVLEKTFDLVLK